MGAQMRRTNNSAFAEVLPGYKPVNGASSKSSRKLARNMAVFAGLCLMAYFFLRSTEITATLGISAPTRPTGRSFSAGYMAGQQSAADAAKQLTQQQQMQQQARSSQDDDGSIIVDTESNTPATATGTGADSSSSSQHTLRPAASMDEHSLEADGAPRFVGDKLVDPMDSDPTGPKQLEANGAGLQHTTQPQGVYALSAVGIDGVQRPLSEYAGKVTLFVNVASHCGYTDANYKGLQRLYEKYKSSGLEILAFPCNQFGAQEPGTDAEIKQFCAEQYHTTFSLFSKIDVNGPSTHPVYQYMKQELHIQDPPGLAWNFQKILVDRAGKPVQLITQEWDQSQMERAVYDVLMTASI